LAVTCPERVDGSFSNGDVETYELSRK
jgi:hypothetical protein